MTATMITTIIQWIGPISNIIAELDYFKNGNVFFELETT